MVNKDSTTIKSAKHFTAAFPGKYIQGENALHDLPSLIRLFGNKGLVVASPTAKNKILPSFYSNDYDELISVEEFCGECCEKELSRLSDIIQSKNIDVVIGMGGGKAIDTAKIVADRSDIAVIIVPTIASSDAPCSGCAVIYSEDGIFDSVYYQKTNPQVVLVDTKVIAHAPTRFLVAGMGDALATWFEARSCESTHSMNECGGYSTLTGLNLARLCYDTLLKYGISAKQDCDDNIVTPALDRIVEANILLSGIGFESSGLGAAHSIHNGLSVLNETHVFYHGEKVAFGVLAGLHLNDASSEEKEIVYSFCEEIGLPTTFADIGIMDMNIDRLMEVAVKSCSPTEGIHHEEGDIIPQKVIEAMLSADAMGKRRKN